MKKSKLRSAPALLALPSVQRTLALSLTLALSFLSSCEQITYDSQMVDVTIGFSDFDFETEPLTRASTGNADDALVRRIVLAVFDSSNKLIADTALSKDVDPANFAKKITLHIPAGSYKFVAAAHTVANTSDPAATVNSVSEVSFGTLTKLGYTYTKVQDVSIDNNTKQNVTFDFGARRNAVFNLCITDNAPSEVQKIEFVVNPSAEDYTDLKVDPATGFASASWRYQNLIDKVEKNITTFTNTSIGIPLLLTSASETVNITINARKTDNSVLFTRTLTNIVLKQAHETTAKGAFFRSDSTSFVFDTNQGSDNISLDK